jgi:hypothetical protein
MKESPEIAPEIRGLLEELVADPRSSMRLVPKRALGSWFDSGETARAREISGTKLERHLIDAHREELAQLLCDAAMISYWKAPIASPLPIGPDGKPHNPASREPHWSLKVRAAIGLSRDADTDLLRGCLSGVRPLGSSGGPRRDSSGGITRARSERPHSMLLGFGDTVEPPANSDSTVHEAGAARATRGSPSRRAPFGRRASVLSNSVRCGAHDLSERIQSRRPRFARFRMCVQPVVSPA